MGENIGRIFKIADTAIGDEGSIGDSVGKMVYSMGCGAGRAYIGISDDGRKLSVYTMRDEGED